MDVVELIDRGNRKSQAEMYEEAIEDFSAAIELDPEEAWAYFFRGDAYEMLEMYEIAIKDYSQAIKIDPHGTFFAGCGDLYRKIEKYEEAIKDYTIANRMEEYLWNYIGRGYAYAHLENYDSAIKDFTVAISILEKEQENTELKNNLRIERGKTYFFNGQYDEAISDLDKVITDESEMDNKINGFRWLGHVYDHLEEFDKAESYFSLAIENANDDDENKGFVYHMYFCRATTRFNMEKYQLCLSDVEKILLEYPDREDCLQLQKDALTELEKSSAKKAIKDDNSDACCAADESYF